MVDEARAALLRAAWGLGRDDGRLASTLVELSGPRKYWMRHLESWQALGWPEAEPLAELEFEHARGFNSIYRIPTRRV